MYQAPDFVKVSTKVKDVFGNYSCVPDYVTTYTQEGPECTSMKGQNITNGLGSTCYRTQNE